MEFKLILPILALFVSFVTGSSFERVLQLQTFDSLMISGGHANYAISSRLLASQNWTTVSANGNHLLVVASDCTKLETTFDELSGEQRELLGSVLKPFEEGATREEDPNFVASFSKSDNNARYGNAIDPYHYIGASPIIYMVRKVSDGNYSIARGKLEERKGISRILFVGHILTIVYSDGRVKMQPINCAEGEDDLLLQEIELDKREGNLMEKAGVLRYALQELEK